MDLAEYRYQILKSEVEGVRLGIDVYNRTLFVVKGWAMSLVTAFLVFAKGESAPSREVSIGLALIVVLLWLLDAVFKSLQRVYIDRAGELEVILRETDPEDIPSVVAPMTENKLAHWRGTMPNSAGRVMFALTVWPVYVALLAIIAAVTL
jgi:hypothetical protein